jgi:hypothetical protein
MSPPVNMNGAASLKQMSEDVFKLVEAYALCDPKFCLQLQSCQRGKRQQSLWNPHALLESGACSYEHSQRDSQGQRHGFPPGHRVMPRACKIH